MVDIVDQYKVGRIGLDLAVLGDEMDPIDGLREVVAGYQTELDVEIDVKREMIEVLASTPLGGLLVAAQGKEG